MQFRWETFNLANTANFDVANMSLDIATAGTYGRYQHTLNEPRIMQFGLRLDRPDIHT